MSNAISTKKESSQLSIRQHLQSDALKDQIAKALPKHCSPDRMMRVTLTALTRTPALANCDQASFFKCLLDLSAWGLEPDGRRAHLIPFENRKRGVTECQLILDYKGLIELAYRSGFVRSIHADVVYAGDLFEFSLGKVTKHTPWGFRLDDGKPDDRGNVIAAYALVELKDGASHHEVMTYEEIEGIRQRSRAGKSGPWVTDWSEMAKKTAFRRASKWIPLAAEVHEAFDADFDRFDSFRTIDSVATKRGVAGVEDRLTSLLSDSSDTSDDEQDGGNMLDRMIDNAESKEDLEHALEVIESNETMTDAAKAPYISRILDRIAEMES